MKPRTSRLGACLLLAPALVFAQGPLDPKKGPEPTMKSLQEIWDRVGTLEAQLASQAAQLSAQTSQIAAQQSRIRSLQLMTGQIAGATANYIWQMPPPYPALGSIGSNSLAFDHGGNPAIACTSSVGGAFTRFNGTAWEVEGINVHAIGGISLAFAPDGQPCIACRENGSNHLVFLRRGPSGWQRTDVDAIFGGLSLAFTPTGQPAIAFADAAVSQLKYAVFNGSTWMVTTVDPTADLAYPSLRFGPDGHPSIAYQDFANRDLRYAKFNGISWQTVMVDSAGDVGYDPSLAFAPNGMPAIAYIDSSNSDAKYAWLQGSNWQSQVADSSAMGLTSLAFGPDGKPMIAFYALELRLARNNGSWATETLDATRFTGRHPSLKFAPDGQPAVSYAGPSETGSPLRYMKKGPFIPAP